MVISGTGASAAEKTQITGTFEGCDYDRVYALENGQVLVCNGYSYHYAYRPDVYILDGNTVLIDGEEYQARVTNGAVMITRVDGESKSKTMDPQMGSLQPSARSCRLSAFRRT